MAYPTTGLVHRYETIAATQADGTAVNGANAWADTVGSNNLAQTSGSGSTTWKTNILNGIRAVRYVTGAGNNFGVSLSSGISTKTFVAVVIPRTNVSATRPIVTMNHSVGGCTNNWSAIYLSGGSSPAKWSLYDGPFNGNNVIQEATGTAVVGTAAVVVGIFTSAGTCELRVNGVSAGTASVGTIASDTSMELGRDVTFDCNGGDFDYFALFVHNVALSGSDLTNAESYATSTYITPSTAYSLTINTLAFTLVDNNVTLTYSPHVGPPGVRGAPAARPATVPTRRQRYYHILDDE